MSENSTSKVKKLEVLCFLLEKSAERWDFEFSATDVCLERKESFRTNDDIPFSSKCTTLTNRFFVQVPRI